MDYILIIIGFALLVLGADWLVDGATGLAKRYNVSDMVIGLTIVAFGTSLPELCVNLMSAVRGSSELALTNILGSNIINVCIILGLSALIYPVAAQPRSRHFDIPLAILAGVAVLILGQFALPGYFGLAAGTRGLTRVGGIILLFIFAFYMYYNITHMEGDDAQSAGSFKPMKLRKSVLLIVVGLVGLAAGAEFIVDSAINIARSWGVSEAVIGVTIVALGTSLPELATSAVAAAKHNTDLALGNVIGSNIFNVFFVLAVSAIIRPLPAYDGLVLDSIMAALSCFLVWVFVQGSRHRVNRWGGAALLLLYGGYLAHLLMNL